MEKPERLAITVADGPDGNPLKVTTTPPDPKVLAPFELDADGNPTKKRAVHHVPADDPYWRRRLRDGDVVLAKKAARSGKEA